MKHFFFYRWPQIFCTVTFLSIMRATSHFSDRQWSTIGLRFVQKEISKNWALWISGSYLGPLDPHLWVVYLCIEIYSMHKFFALKRMCTHSKWANEQTLKMCVHILFGQNFVFPFLFCPSHSCCYSPSFHLNTSRKWLTPSFFNAFMTSSR